MQSKLFSCFFSNLYIRIKYFLLHIDLTSTALATGNIVFTFEKTMSGISFYVLTNYSTRERGNLLKWVDL